jgi:hypothetical protein
VINHRFSKSHVRFLTGLLITWSILTACGPSATPEATAELDAMTPAAPTTAATTTVLPTSTQPPVPTPTSLPVNTPVPGPAETSPDLAGNPDLDFAQVIFVRATQNSAGLWNFDTTVRHNDEGWDHYADAWVVVDLEGKVLAERILTHPHDTEQPFTRSQSSIDISPDSNEVIVRAKCNVHGFGGQEILVELTAAEGENFEVIRNQ